MNFICIDGVHIKVDKYGTMVYAHPDTDPKEVDGLPWELSWIRCTLCSYETQVITHFPTIRKDLYCPECKCWSMDEKY